MAKTKVELSTDLIISAGATEVWESAVIPSGKTFLMQELFASSIEGDYVVLQWGSSGSWETVTGFYGIATRQIKKEFVGDGVKKFRVVRVNSGGSARRIFVELFGFIDR